MGFVSNDFGTLREVSKDDSYVYVTNMIGERRKMSIGKYQESSDRVYTKAQNLIGKEVKVQTSQNTGDWSTSVWFSDIFEK